MQSRWLSVLVMALAGASYGLVTPLAKGAVLAGIPVRLFTPWQYGLPLLIFFLVPTRTKSLPPPGQWVNAAVVGALGGATALAYYQTVRLLPAAQAVMLLFQFAWMLPLIGRALTGVKPTWMQWGAIGAVWLGTLLTLRSFRLDGMGIILGLISALAYALMLFMQGRLAPSVSIWHSARFSTAAGALVVVAAYRPWTMGFPHPLSLIIWASAIGVAGQALPLILTYLSAPRLGPTLTAVLASSELPVAVALSSLFFRESAGWPIWTGIFLILAGIAWGAWGSA
ncbi:DMT family transporter [Sulfobacillus harzensis]|uniref:DMT family transporter n=1 Tax=Sulfobacillus harzensis TaxID=2729629 RepID=A0A7Y0Q1R7_9FIRM|nr:DMT family transporter [Sulfobacillus harzensis]NMP21121.1 DMT family transporter [Sulfobacillus harzensis]